MKKRAVLFLLVLCAVLSFACSALAISRSENYNALPITSTYEDEELLRLLKLEKTTYTAPSGETKEEQLKSGDWAKIGVPLTGLDVVIGNDKGEKLNVYFFVTGYYNPNKITIKPGSTLSGDQNVSFINCPIENRGTIDFYEGKIITKTVHYNTVTYTNIVYNYGDIKGGIFTGTVVNMPGGTISGGDFSKATLKVGDGKGNETPVTDISTSPFANAQINVTLDLDGGTLAAGDEGKIQQTIMCGASLMSAPPTKDGKQFAYWEDEFGYHYTNDSISLRLRKSDGTPMKLKAVWADFLIYYEGVSPGDDATPLVDTMVPQAFTIGESKKLEEMGFVYYQGNLVIGGGGGPYRADGWNSQKDGLGRNYMIHDGYKFTATECGSMTLYPRWKSDYTVETDGYSVLYKSDKGSVVSLEIPITPLGGYNYHELLDPTKLDFTASRGKKFSGWLLSPSHDTKDWVNATGRTISFADSTETYQPGEKVFLLLWENPYPYDSEVTTVYSKKTIITAKWDSLPVTEITFDANGAGATGTTGNGNKETYFLNETLPLPKNGFVRTDYIFTGWNTKADGTGTSYEDEAEITIEGEALEGKNVTLYAQWKSTKPVTPTPTVQPETPTPTTQPTNPLPQTGDNANQPLWLALCMASVVAMAALIIMKKRSFSQR